MYDWHYDSTVEDTWFLVLQAGEAMSRQMSGTLRRQPVTPDQIRILYFLSTYPDGATIDEISTFCFRRKESVLRLIERMEKKKLVYRKRQPLNRHVFFYSTDKGKEVYNSSHIIGYSVVDNLNEEFSEEELQGLNIYLKRIRDLYLRQLGLQAINPPIANDKPGNNIDNTSSQGD